MWNDVVRASRRMSSSYSLSWCVEGEDHPDRYAIFIYPYGYSPSHIVQHRSKSQSPSLFLMYSRRGTKARYSRHRTPSDLDNEVVRSDAASEAIIDRSGDSSSDIIFPIVQRC